LTTHETQPRQRIDGYGVRGEIADITDGAGGVALCDEVTETIAQPGKVRARDRPPDSEGDRFLLRHRYW
jgi:hypothetical protein